MLNSFKSKAAEQDKSVAASAADVIEQAEDYAARFPIDMISLISAESPCSWYDTRSRPARPAALPEPSRGAIFTSTNCCTREEKMVRWRTNFRSRSRVPISSAGANATTSIARPAMITTGAATA